MIAIIGAMESEIKNIKSLMNITETKKISDVEYYMGSIKDKGVVIANCGEGKVNAAICMQTLYLNFDIHLVINIGVAGGLTNNINILDLAIAISTVEHDYDLSPLGYEKGYVLGINKINVETDDFYTKKLFEISKEKYTTKLGVIASGDEFVTDKEKIKYLNTKFNAIAVDMESASIAHVCDINKIPFVILRAISDSGDKIEFREFLDRAVIQITDVIVSFLKEI